VTADNPDGEDSVEQEHPSAPEELPAPGVMLPKEQQTGYLVAIAIGILVLVIGIWRQTHSDATGSLGTAALGVAAAGAMAYAARRGKRLFAAIISIVGGLALTGYFPLNFIFLGYGAYLMFKQSQAQKKLNKAGIRRTRTPRTRGETPARRKARGRDEAASNRPKANRRYTPPKSTKPKRPRPAATTAKPKRDSSEGR
jgi:hypothetical protein